MVKENKDGMIKINVSFMRSVYDKIAAQAAQAGLKVDEFIALSMETLTVDPLLQVLAEDPVQAREIALKAIGDYLNGVPAAPAVIDTGEPPPPPDPVDEELKQTIGGLAALTGALAKEFGVNIPGPDPAGQGPPASEKQSGDPGSPPAPKRRTAKPA